MHPQLLALPSRESLGLSGSVQRLVGEPRQYCMASERKDAVEIRGCCSVACCPSAPQAEAMSCFKTEEVLRCWRELVHEKYGEEGEELCCGRS